MKTVQLYPSGDYPCSSVDLLTDSNEHIATLYTKKRFNGKNFRFREGIIHAADNIFDIIIDNGELTRDVALKWVKKLSKRTGVQYVL